MCCFWGIHPLLNHRSVICLVVVNVSDDLFLILFVLEGLIILIQTMSSRLGEKKLKKI